MTHDIAVKMMRLIRRVLQSTPFEESFTPEELELLFELAYKHNVDNMVFYGLQANQIELPPILQQKWQAHYNGNLIKTIYQQQAYQELSQQFEQEGIDFLSLKGVLLQSLYPQADFRYLGDLDILVKQPDFQKAHEQLQQLGYEVVRQELDNHDEYHKWLYGANIIVELHRALFDDLSQFKASFQADWQDYQRIANSQHQYRMNPVTEYVYLIVHFAKHYFGAGSGIRSLLDVYLYGQRYGINAQHPEVARQLRGAHLDTFAHTLEHLLAVWFEEATPTVETQEMAEYVWQSGSYGDLAQLIANKVDKQGMWAFLRQRIFPSYEQMKRGYAIFNKRHYPYPIAWFIRLWLILSQNRPKLKYEMEQFMSVIKRPKH